MLKVLLALLFLFQDAPIAITSPQPGETLRGQVNIVGNMSLPNFASAELAFAYASDPTSTWFTIQTFSSPLPAGDPQQTGAGGSGARDAFTTWDTTTLTDGDYTLRLRVTLLDGTAQEVLVSDLKIRNDASPETATPTPTLEPESAPVASLPTSTPFSAGSVPAATLPAHPTPTLLPVNPAALTVSSVYSNFTCGTIITLALFALVGILLRLRVNK